MWTCSEWLSPDPIGELGPDGANLYDYVQNNPINAWDPTDCWWHLHDCFRSRGFR